MMTQPYQIRRSILAGITLAVLLLSSFACTLPAALLTAGTATPAVTEVEAVQVSPTLTPTFTATTTFTITPTVTSTSTPLPTATVTPTITPTATPFGFQNHTNGGFSLTAPSGWLMMNDQGDQLTLMGPNGDFIFVMSSSSEEGTLTDDELEILGSV